MTVIMKVEMTLSLIGQAVILVIICVETFKTDRIVFSGYVIMCLMSHWSMVFSIRISLL